ncbi:mediator of RNA polymerase II transcription subunit 1-domain-containing protein [Apodospora peruviana]|uniref:Mediator of RNA polymerase II transcription subunit 1 n=1 Tax=Apodospora peruviana TaxID=516989 RepID=A0AAE0MBL2_9PEZI|nr:mediator of RNA polymerase II transcription subunit 1-domain-containing protein [Apodospora peruviana]
MATPTATAMKHALSQQGRTPSQSQSQHGAAATPPVSTPFSAAHAAFSPRGPRSSPQQVKKSPATATTATMMGHPSNAPISFDSPSAAALFGALQLGGAMDLGIQGLGGLSSDRSTEGEFSKRLDNVIAILSQNKGLVSEAGLERLAKRLGLDCLWEGVEPNRTLIVAGAALELLVVFSNNIVESVSLAFPESADIVNKHAEEAGKILLDDLKLGPNQSPLTKRLDNFAANFERLAMLDKLSVNPGLNLYEAVAGIHESLARLHQWELQKLREDLALTGKSDAYLQNLVLCTRSGHPAMNARHRVGLGIDYWKEKRLVPPTDARWIAQMANTEKIWTLLIGCSPLQDIAFGPVRISDKWIAADIEKMQTLPGELHHSGGGPILDWLEPDNTLMPLSDQDKANAAAGGDLMNPGGPMLGPRLPEVTFHATFDPPLVVSSLIWNHIGQLGCGLPAIGADQMRSYDNILFPTPPGYVLQPSEPRIITCSKKVEFTPRGPTQRWSLKSHANTLYIQKAIYGYTLTELTFSHPRQLVSMLPYLRQYAFLSTLLENSFQEKPGPSSVPDGSKPSTISTRTTTSRDEFARFMAESAETDQQAPQPLQQREDKNEKEEEPLKVDVTLFLSPVPRLHIVFPFKEGVTGNVVLEIRENGQVHIEAQNVLDEGNAFYLDGRPRRVEDLGKILETIEDIGKWCEFLRSRWAYLPSP